MVVIVVVHVIASFLERIPLILLFGANPSSCPKNILQVVIFYSPLPTENNPSKSGLDTEVCTLCVLCNSFGRNPST